MYFGRATVFAPFTPEKDRFLCLINDKNWRFIPELEEFQLMLTTAGFGRMAMMTEIHQKADQEIGKKDMRTVSFLVSK